MAIEDDEFGAEPDVVENAAEVARDWQDLFTERFRSAETGRYNHEQRWLQSYKNFRGNFNDGTTQYRDSERSKVFLKITKTKVLAAYGQIVDILFANKKFPIQIEPTPVPEGIAEFAHLETPLDQAAPLDPYGYKGDGLEIPPGAMIPEENDFLGGLAESSLTYPLLKVHLDWVNLRYLRHRRLLVV